MSSPQVSVPPLSDSSTATSSGPTTPDNSLIEAVSQLGPAGGDVTPIAKLREKGGGGIGKDSKDADAMRIPPPVLPVTIHAPTPPRMTRMPSLSQITEHLHIPSPLSSASSPITPPKLSLLTNPASLPSPATATAGASSPFAPSPSGRLKLPASAMSRTRSGSSSHSHGPGLTTIAALGSRTMERKNSSDSAVSTGTVMGPPPVPAPAPAPATPDSTQPSPRAPGDAFSSHAASASGSLRRQPSREYVQGYKDVPSLAAIRQRLSISHGSPAEAKAAMSATTALNEPRQVRPLQQDGGEDDMSADEKDLENVEALLEESKGANESPPDTAATTGSTMSIEVNLGRKEEHPLRHSWTLFFDAKAYTPEVKWSAAKHGGKGLGDYEKSLLQVGNFNTVESFARHMNNLRLPTQLRQNSNYHLFKEGILPMWEDPANASGGKWVILFRQAPHLLDAAWANLTMALVGQILDPDDIVCGIVASSRPKVDRVQVWTRGREDVGALNGLAQRCLEAMDLDKGDMDNVSMEFQYNATHAHPPPNQFLHITYPTRSFSHSPSTPSRMGPPGFPPSINLPSAPSASHHPSPLLHPHPQPHQNTAHSHRTSPVLHPLPLNPNNGNLNLNLNLPVPAPSPLSQSTKASSRPVSPSPSPSPAISPTPSPRMSHALPKMPDSLTVKTALDPLSGGRAGSPHLAAGQGGGLGMRRMGSGQGASAFSGPMGSLGPSPARTAMGSLRAGEKR